MVVDIGVVRHKARLRGPAVQMERGRLQHQGAVHLRSEGEFHLMRDGRADGGDRTGDTGENRPVMVAADDPLDLGMTRDHGRERTRVRQVDTIHVFDAAHKRRMMHGDHGWPVRRGLQCLVEKGQSLLAERPVCSAADEGIQHDQPDWELIDDVLDEALVAAHPGQVAQVMAEAVAVIVVARD